MERKLIKIVYHFDDGTSQFVEGDELDRLNGFTNQTNIFCAVHHMNPDWKQVKWAQTEAIKKQKNVENTELLPDTEKVD